MQINWSLRELEVFLVLAETLSFRRTAAQVNLSQSAVSGVVTRLEGALAVRLFDRNTRNVQLTVAGQVFAEQALLLHVEVLGGVELNCCRQGRAQACGALADERPDRRPTGASRFEDFARAVSEGCHQTDASDSHAHHGTTWASCAEAGSTVSGVLCAAICSST